MGLDHVLLDHGCTGHGVVEHVEELVDGLRGDFLAETLLQGLVGKVHVHEDGPPDIVPHLLHGSVVDEVQVVALNEHAGARDLVGHQLALPERDAADVAADGVVHGDATGHCCSVPGFDELHLPRGLLQALAGKHGARALGVLGELLFQGLQEELLGSLDLLCHVNHSSGT